MGKVIVKLKLTNYPELVLEKRRLLKGKPRQVEVDALVDSGATRLYLKSSVIKSLGLNPVDRLRSRTISGPHTARTFEPVRLELMGRYGEFGVVEVDDSVPNLLGQIPLEHLDLVVDSKSRKLIPNPEHGGEWMSEAYLDRPMNRQT